MRAQDLQEARIEIAAPAPSTPAQYFAETRREAEHALTEVSLALKPGAFEAERQIEQVRAFMGQQTEFIIHQDMMLQTATALKQQLEREVVYLAAELDAAQIDAQQGYDVGYEVGYDAAFEDFAGENGDEDGERTSNSSRREMGRLQRELDQERQNGAQIAREMDQQSAELAALRAELVQKQAQLDEAARVEAELAEAREVIARAEAWYQAQFAKAG